MKELLTAALQEIGTGDWRLGTPASKTSQGRDVHEPPTIKLWPKVLKIIPLPALDACHSRQLVKQTVRQTFKSCPFQSIMVPHELGFSSRNEIQRTLGQPWQCLYAVFFSCLVAGFVVATSVLSLLIVLLQTYLSFYILYIMLYIDFF